MKTLMMRMAFVSFCVYMPLSAKALPFKKCSVLGSDGQIYNGASPAEVGKLISVAKEERKTVGVFGGNIFVIMNDGVTFIPITDLAGESEEDIQALVVERVTAGVMRRLAEFDGDAAAPAVTKVGTAALASKATSAPDDLRGNGSSLGNGRGRI